MVKCPDCDEYEKIVNSLTLIEEGEPDNVLERTVEKCIVCTSGKYLPFVIAVELWKKAKNKDQIWPLIRLEIREKECLLGQFILGKKEVEQIKNKLRNERCIVADCNEKERAYSFWLEGSLLLKLKNEPAANSVFVNLNALELNPNHKVLTATGKKIVEQLFKIEGAEFVGIGNDKVEISTNFYSENSNVCSLALKVLKDLAFETQDVEIIER